MDGARGLVDLDWSQRTPIFHLDNIDWDPRFNQYPYPDDNLDYDDEEEMETDYQNAPLGGTGDACVATPASAGCRCYRPPATYSMQTSQGQTSGLPQCNMLKLPPHATLTRSIFNSTKLPYLEV